MSQGVGGAIGGTAGQQIGGVGGAMQGVVTAGQAGDTGAVLG